MRHRGPFPRDTRGTEITPGAEVAYNYSGDVVRGRVLRIGGNTIFVEVTESKDGFYPRVGHVSKVKNARGVLVLDQRESGQYGGCATTAIGPP